MAKRETISKGDNWKPKGQGRDYTKRTETPEVMKTGETLEGRILAIQAGAMSPILCVKEDSTGKTRRIWMPTVLQNAINADDVGDFVAIECKGETHTQQGRKLIDFEVFIAPAKGSHDSDDMPRR